jgi:hypothetical protein
LLEHRAKFRDGVHQILLQWLADRKKEPLLNSKWVEGHRG